MNRGNLLAKSGSSFSMSGVTPSPKQRVVRIGENRLFFVILFLSIILLFIPGTTKLKILSYPRAILLAPLNITLRFFDNLHNLKQENLRLSQLATLLQIENAKLKEALGPAKADEIVRSNFTLSSAHIIGRDRETMGRYLLLDKGESAGIKINQPVITESGVVGKIIQTSPIQSLVETMLSPDSKIAALCQRSRVTGVVTVKAKNQLKMDYVIPEADVQIGDTIASSGLGGVFSKGLLIGTVEKRQNRNQGLFQDIILKPFVNIYALERVYIILDSEAKPSRPKINSPQANSPAPEKDWEKTLQQLKIEPPLEIKIR